MEVIFSPKRSGEECIAMGKVMSYYSDLRSLWRVQWNSRRVYPQQLRMYFSWDVINLFSGYGSAKIMIDGGAYGVVCSERGGAAPIGEPIRSPIMTGAMYNDKNDMTERFTKCFVEATRYFMDNPQAAERYGGEKMFKGQLTAEDYRDAMADCSLTYDVTVGHVQISTSMMAKYGIAKMTNPPAAKDYVKLNLLQKAKEEFKLK